MSEMTEKLAKDAAGAELPERPEPAPPAFSGLRQKLLTHAGVKMSKDGNCVFNYNPGKVTAGFNWLGVMLSVRGMFTRSWYYQMLVIYAWAVFYMFVLSDSNKGDIDGPRGPLDSIVMECFNQISGLTRFVLGLYISLALARTYYSNRSVFGTVFGSSMGLSQMIAAWVRSPDNKPSTHESARCAQDLLVRWINAAYRLLVLEVKGVDADEIGDELVRKKLLTMREWAHISSLSSRATHIYQWINNVLLDLVRDGYIKDTRLLTAMNHEVDAMRGANVWGLPSLPLPYTLMITSMVKMHLFFMANLQGSNLNRFCPTETPTFHNVFPVVALCGEIFVQNFLYQGMLDMHGWLYSPNGGELLGHLPAENFLDFVQNVTMDMVSKSGSEVPEKLPYNLKLAKPAVMSPGWCEIGPQTPRKLN